MPFGLEKYQLIPRLFPVPPHSSKLVYFIENLFWEKGNFRFSPSKNFFRLFQTIEMDFLIKLLNEIKLLYYSYCRRGTIYRKEIPF